MSSVSVSLRERPVEPLLSPVLEIVAKEDPIKVVDIARRLSSRGLLGHATRDEVNDITSEPGQTVVMATINLKEAGLIESVAPTEWKITPAGKRQLAKRERITFEMLRRRPKFQEHLKQLTAKNRRKNWQELRFDYYVAGRLLALQGSAHAAATTLAYAIEYSFKAALDEVPSGIQKRVLHSHDFPTLYRTCLEHHLLEETYISDDFLEYAQHHFERRYPSGHETLLSERRHWIFGAGFLPTYDDCMVQFDRGLDHLYGSSEWSLGNRALRSPGGELSRAFFHQNAFAVDRLADYRASVEDGLLGYPEPEHLERQDLLFEASEKLPHPGVSYERAKGLLDLNLAALFIYPEGSAPHPDPVRTFLPRQTALPGNSYNYDWILKRLQEEFGSASVEVIEETGSHSITILVYDRTATQYWSALPVTRNHLLLIYKGAASKEALERWIEETKEMFASERRDLRLPPQMETG